MATLGSLIISLEANTAKFESAMTKAQYTAKKSSDAIKGTFIALGAAIAGAFSISAFESMVKGVADTESAMLKMASRLNTNVETLSSFGVMIRKTGMDTDAFYTALTRLEKGISAAASKAEQSTGAFDEEGNEIMKTASAYNELGLNAEILNKMPLDQKLMALAEAFKKNIDPADRVRVAMEIGGRTAAGLVNIFSGGAIKIQEWIAQQQNLGIITTDNAKKAMEFSGAVKDLDAAWEAFKRNIAEGVIPGLTDLISKLNVGIAKSREMSENVKIAQENFPGYQPYKGGPLTGAGPFGEAAEAFFGPAPYKPPPGLEKPPVRPGDIVKGGKGGGGAGDMGLDRMRSIIDTLQKDLSRLTEGSLAEIREWANHTRNEIEKVGRKGAETEEAMRLVATVEGKKKEKAIEDYYLFVAKESGDNYKQIEADAKEWLTKYKGFNDAETNINAIKNRKIWEEDNRQMTERLTLRASLMSSIANEMPLLSQNLAIKEKMLPIEDAIAKLNLERALSTLKISDAQKDELRGLLALASAAKKYTLEREKWAKEGVAGGMKIYALGKKQTGETNVAEATKKVFGDVEKSVASFIGKGIKSVLFGEGKVDFAELGKEIASSFIDTAIELAVSKLFEALAATFLESIMVTVPTEITTATTTAAIQTTAAMTSGTILTTAGEILASEMISGATTAASILTGGGGGGGELGGLGSLLSVFGFHQGGMVEAHSGWPLRYDERIIKVQTGERVLSRKQNQEYESGTDGIGFGGVININPRYPMSRQETEHMVRTKLIPAMAKQQKRMGGKYR